MINPKDLIQKVEIESIGKSVLWDEFKKVSQEHLGKPFELNDQNKNVVFTILRYFSGVEDFDSDGVVINKASQEKGLLVFGTYGVGKTVLFDILRKVGLNLFKSYNYKRLQMPGISCGNFVQLYMMSTKRDDININIESRYKGKLYIDDLGVEQKCFNNYELIGDILFERYRNNAPTYVTTNLKPSEIVARYGDRIGDRLPEMFNIIKWNGKSFRKDL